MGLMLKEICWFEGKKKSLALVIYEKIVIKNLWSWFLLCSIVAPNKGNWTIESGEGGYWLMADSYGTTDWDFTEVYPPLLKSSVRHNITNSFAVFPFSLSSPFLLLSWWCFFLVNHFHKIPHLQVYFWGIQSMRNKKWYSLLKSANCKYNVPNFY